MLFMAKKHVVDDYKWVQLSSFCWDFNLHKLGYGPYNYGAI